MEKLTVQDLAMFIGCKVKYRGNIYDLITISMSNGWESNQQYVEIGTLGEETSDDDISVDYDEVIPIIRPLSDITESELIDIAKIIYGQPDSVKWKVEFNKYRNCHLVYRKHYSKRFTFCCETGEIECYEMDMVDECKDIYNNQHYVTKYLISKQFDLFNWIQKGLAIDRNKLN
jgi:hypothetical protein